jgi:hypothetical protein
MPCVLDYFPCEILHTIFDYLKPIDLLHAFVQLNPYIDTVFNSYIRIQLNFKSIKKSIFYFICENVHSYQIQSLIISDDEYTPGQTKLFMSLLPLIQFNNLQYFSLDQIHDPDLLCVIFSHLENHIQIRWLSITGSHIQINKNKTRYIVGILQTLPLLKRLTFIDSSSLLNLRQPLSKLTHLTICSCTFNDLRVIFQWVPNLLHLQIMIPFNNHIPIFDDVPPHLISLEIESRSWTLFNELENLLSLMTSLKRLTLETMGEQALLDARRWEILIKTKLPHLKELALNITPEENNMTGDDVLTPFQNSFWTIEKRWLMACLISSTTQSCARLFFVPHFAPIEAWYPPSEGFFNYSLTPYSFDENCTDLRVSSTSSDALIPSSFKHVHTLSLEYNTDNIKQLQAIVNLLSVNHLKFRYSGQCTVFNDILQAAPNINQLSMNCATLVRIINSLPNDQNVYEQIKQLNVNDTLFNMTIDQIYKIFPKLEHISISIKEREDIVPILNKFPYLISAIVHWTDFSRTSLSVVDRCLQENNMSTDGTYRLGRTSLNIWMD